MAQSLDQATQHAQWQRDAFGIMAQSLDQATQHAQWQRDAFGIPEYVYQAWRMHRAACTHRQIPFNFTLYAWYTWWKRELAKIGPDAKRGLQRGQYVMRRCNSSGSYEDGNVYCVLNGYKRDEVTHEFRCWLKGKRGDDHPRSRPVIDPHDHRYGSIALAGEAYGVSRQAIHRRMRDPSSGWRYVDGDPTVRATDCTG